MNKYLYIISIVFLTFVISVLLYKFIEGENGVMDNIRFNKEIQRLKEEKKELEKKNRELRIKIEKFEKDRNFKEKVIREKLDMVKDNEIDVKFKRKSDDKDR